MSYKARLTELGLILPEPPRLVGYVVPAVQVGNLLFVSGQIAPVSGLTLGAPVELERTAEVQM